MNADSQPDRENTCWAVLIPEGICEVIEIDRDDVGFVLQAILFEAEEAAVSYALEHAEHLAGYWERQADLLRRRLLGLATRGDIA